MDEINIIVLISARKTMVSRCIIISGTGPPVHAYKIGLCIYCQAQPSPSFSLTGLS